MSDSIEEFTLLSVSARRLAEQNPHRSVSEVATDSAGGHLLFAADGDRSIHILAENPTQSSFAPYKGRVIDLREWVDPRNGTAFIDLGCYSEALQPVFYSLADRVRSRLAESDSPSSEALLREFADWRSLLQGARTLSDDQALGLFGELVVLRHLARINPRRALESWHGPEGSSHDFRTPSGDLEVKTTAKEGLSVTISSLDQLEESGSALWLVRLRAIPTPGGESLGAVVDELVHMGCRQIDLQDKLERVGFNPSVDDDSHSFEVVQEPMAWLVDDSFPRLRFSSLSSEFNYAISRVSYDVDLQAVHAPLSTDAFAELCDRMVAQ